MSDPSVTATILVYAADGLDTSMQGMRLKCESVLNRPAMVDLTFEGKRVQVAIRALRAALSAVEASR